MIEYISCLAYSLAGICYLYFGLQPQPTRCSDKRIAYLFLAFAYVLLSALSMVSGS